MRLVQTWTTDCALPPGGPGPCEFLYGVRSAAPVYMSRTPSSHSLETGARDTLTLRRRPLLILSFPSRLR
uniref:Expressed protein n=1 Tax=Schizophyllum commune (strain H4-8 / FGSC 9210) TaxID=578458 RepID=D8PKT4_SCHCM